MQVRRSLVVAAAVIVVAAGSAAWVMASASAPAGPLCGQQARSVAGGAYVVQNNEFDSTAPMCVVTGDGTSFRVRNSSLSNATDSFAGAYPSIYQGCHWGRCSSGGLASKPVMVEALTTGAVTASWSTTVPASRGSYYVAYDIWFNKTPTTAGQPDCTELMVWLNHSGPVQPSGRQIARDVSAGGRTYNIWAGQRPSWDTITYDMTTGATSVRGLDIGTLAQDAVSRGYLSRSCYLISVEAGFGLWHGGTGLATNSFSVDINATAAAAFPSGQPAFPRKRPLPLELAQYHAGE